MSFKVQGWCPGALRPMASGDGLVVRVRPRGGRITPEQAAGIATASRAHGNGLIDLSGRANVQLRGVSAETHSALIADLTALGLIDADIAAETRRNVIVTPFADAQTDALAADLVAALADAPELPGKFGFALDTGPAPLMADTPADIRLERAADGRLILRAAGMDLGAPVAPEAAVQAAVDLARWFVDQGGVVNGRGRMASLIARGAYPEGAVLAPAPALAPSGPGLVAQGALVAFEFGQMQAETFWALGRLGPLRITPWRMVLIEGLREMPELPGLIIDATDPLLRVYACTGAPGCLQAEGPTRDLARALAPRVPKGRILHVSGCAKGCAWPARADLALVATERGYDLVTDGTAADTPARVTLDPTEIPDLPEFS
ncbi:precorrin-3B synthase [Sedimentimonas flavescens]|uniref:precorrin-3B synthase n=1 Tax=Sedimentimonas flavescens TaxID=2851012 RepID=UPI0021A58FBC|nr:precorrin-3B synthase [Sedimentimonas flavescens]MCT2539840.1 precorrin-3B synthase [Sedimentimonas flavescens]